MAPTVSIGSMASDIGNIIIGFSKWDLVRTNTDMVPSSLQNLRHAMLRVIVIHKAFNIEWQTTFSNKIKLIDVSKASEKK
jgi:hypothetical protein